MPTQISFKIRSYSYDKQGTSVQSEVDTISELKYTEEKDNKGDKGMAGTH